MDSNLVHFITNLMEINKRLNNNIMIMKKIKYKCFYIDNNLIPNKITSHKPYNTKGIKIINLTMIRLINI